MSHHGKKTSQKNAAGQSSAQGGKVAGRKNCIIVIWDIENCGIPARCKTRQVIKNIRLVIGPNVEFYIFGDNRTLSDKVRKEIHAAVPSAAVFLAPSGEPDYGDKEMIAMIHDLAAENKDIEHFLLITGDVDFSTSVSFLRQQNFSVGVACVPNRASPLLKWSANYALNWAQLANGILEYVVPPRAQTVLPTNTSLVEKIEMPIYIYWDLTTGIIPKNYQSSVELMFRLTELLQNKLRKDNLWGPFKVCAYGDVRSVSRMNQQAFHYNCMSIQPVARENWWNVDHGKRLMKMIETDVNEKMLECGDNGSIFLIITDKDTRSIEQTVESQDHYYIHVIRSGPSTYAPNGPSTNAPNVD